VRYEAGEWDLANARVVEAQDAQEAAERVCGGPLLSKGNIGQLRAQVTPISRPRSKTTFYAPDLAFLTTDQPDQRRRLRLTAKPMENVAFGLGTLAFIARLVEGPHDC
jgi:hypothetical protein